MQLSVGSFFRFFLNKSETLQLCIVTNKGLNRKFPLCIKISSDDVTVYS